MPVTNSMRWFAWTALVFQVFFAIIYAFQMNIVQLNSFADLDGLVLSIFLAMLLLVGFGLMTVYIRGSALSGLLLNFILLAFTLQWYFLVRKFWYAIKLTDNVNTTSLGDSPSVIRLSSLMHYDYTTNNPTINNDPLYFSMGSAFACAISMFVAISPMIGKIGPGQAIYICLFGNIGYTLVQAIFWRLGVQDNGYGLRVFLFGSVMGMIVTLIHGRDHSDEHRGYTTMYSHQTMSLIGSIFVWILLPWLSVIQQSQQTISSATKPDYRQIAPLNMIFALASSTSASFFTSVWIRGKIAVHDVIYASFSGGIAYSASSNVFPNPFPAMIIGTLVGMFTTFINSKKMGLNEEGVVDSQGTTFIFLIPSLIGGLYSAILFTTTAYGPLNDESYTQVDPNRNRFAQGGLQVAGTFIVIGIGVFFGLIVGMFNKMISQIESDEDVFNDDIYIEKNNKQIKLLVLKSR